MVLPLLVCAILAIPGCICSQINQRKFVEGCDLGYAHPFVDLIATIGLRSRSECAQQCASSPGCLAFNSKQTSGGVVCELGGDPISLDCSAAIRSPGSRYMITTATTGTTINTATSTASTTTMSTTSTRAAATTTTITTTTTKLTQVAMTTTMTTTSTRATTTTTTITTTTTKITQVVMTTTVTTTSTRATTTTTTKTTTTITTTTTKITQVAMTTTVTTTSTRATTTTTTTTTTITTTTTKITQVAMTTTVTTIGCTNSAYTYAEAINSCYKVVTSPALHHSNAKQACETEGGTLLMITSNEINIWIQNELSIIDVSAFIDGHYKPLRDIWQFGNAGEMTFFDWESNPDTNATKNCVILDQRVSFKWNNIVCNEVYAYICQMAP